MSLLLLCVFCSVADKPWDAVVSVTRRSSGVAPRACVRVYARVLLPPNLYIHTYICSVCKCVEGVIEITQDIHVVQSYSCMYYIHNTPTQLPTCVKQCQPQPTHTPNPDDANRMQYSHMTLTQPQTYDNAIAASGAHTEHPLMLAACNTSTRHQHSYKRTTITL